MKILIMGRITPPYGGVVASVQNLCHSLDYKKITYDFISCKSLLKRYDVVHIHYSKLWKVAIGAIIGKIVAKKVIVTKHGRSYDTNSMWFKLLRRLVNGVIFLNSCASTDYQKLFRKSCCLSSVFKEGFITSQKKISNVLINKDPTKKYVLFYANGKVFQNGRDVYGGDFLIDNFNEFDKQSYVLVFLDPNKGYESDIESIKDKLFYVDRFVDFNSLLDDVDVYIRPSTSDGDSVAIYEALIKGIPVIASDSVTRGDGVVTYKSGDFSDFVNKLGNCKVNSNSMNVSSIEDYLGFIKELNGS